MSEHLEFIDSYFQKQLNETERAQFEQLCATDEKFASEVAFYINSRSALNEILLDQKKSVWAGIAIKESEDREEAPVRKLNFNKWIAYAAAACVILALLMVPMFRSQSPRKLADTYTTEHLTAISQTMDGARDSLQLGIQAFNKKDYETAISYFKGVYAAYPNHSDALRYIGQTQLMQGSFDAAIGSFDQLSQKQTYSNPGLFLKAIALLKRNQGDDSKQARALLQKVVGAKLDGSKEATEWLKNWSDK